MDNRNLNGKKELDATKKMEYIRGEFIRGYLHALLASRTRIEIERLYECCVMNLSPESVGQIFNQVLIDMRFGEIPERYKK